MTIEKYNLQLFVRSYICFVYLCLGSYWEDNWGVAFLGMGRKHGFSGNNKKRRNREQQENSLILDGECKDKGKVQKNQQELTQDGMGINMNEIKIVLNFVCIGE